MVLLNTDSYSLLPELYDVFGEDNLIKFLDVFAGNTITVPGKKKFASAVQKIEIYSRLEVKKNKPTIKELADEYEVSEKYISNSYLEIKTLVENTNTVFLKEKNGTRGI